MIDTLEVWLVLSSSGDESETGMSVFGLRDESKNIQLGKTEPLLYIPKWAGTCSTKPLCLVIVAIVE